MTVDLQSLVALFTLVQLLFLAVVAFTFRRGRTLSNRLLAGFFASNALLIAHLLLTHFRLISADDHPLLFSLGKASYLLLMPFLYFYIRSLCYRDFRLKPQHLLHVLLFLVAAAFTFTTSAAGPATSSSLREMEQGVHYVLIHTQIAAYLVASAWTLRVYRRHLRQIYSSLDRIDLSWCNLLLIGFTCMWLVDLSSVVLRTFGLATGPMQYVLLLGSLLINMAFTLAVAYKGLVRAESFSGILMPPKYASSPLKPAEGAEIVEKLTSFMSGEKPYLEASITVEDLAKRLNVSARHLSQAIHTHLNQNFYDLMNHYRIEAAKQRLQDASSRSHTLLAVAYDVGFNSKSVFNAAFKKHAGMTPKEFRKSIRE